MTRAELPERLRRLKPWLAEQGIEKLRLFGSFARDEAGPDSDADLIVDVTKPMGRELLRAERLLGAGPGRRVEFCSEEVMNPIVVGKVRAEALVV